MLKCLCDCNVVIVLFIRVFPVTYRMSASPPSVNIPQIKYYSITEYLCHWQVFHLLFPISHTILYIEKYIFWILYVSCIIQIGYDFRSYSPFHSDSESHVDRCAKSNCRHRVKHINIALNRSNKLNFSVNLLIILTQERISETENQWFTVERVAFACTGTLKTMYLGNITELQFWLHDWLIYVFSQDIIDCQDSQELIKCLFPHVRGEKSDDGGDVGYETEQTEAWK